MLDWLKNINKDYPEFWKTYLSKFEKKSTRFVALSTESSGLNPVKDVIFSMGCIGIVAETVVISDSFEIEILQKDSTTNRFLGAYSNLKLSEPEGVKAFIDYLGNAVLVGHRIHYDVDMINAALDKMDCGRLKNEALDIEVMYKKLHDINDKQFTLEDLSRTYKTPINERNTSADDAYTIALLFLKLKARLDINQ